MIKTERQLKRAFKVTGEMFELLVQIKQALVDDPKKAKGIWGTTTINEIEKLEKYIAIDKS